jgi:hypothetical protein
VALAYSLAVTGPLLVLLPWLGRSERWRALTANSGWLLHPHGAGQAVGTLLAVAVVIAIAWLLRYLLLTLFSPRR